MQLVSDPFVDPADHLAMDEAMLLEADEGKRGAAMRVWEFDDTVVVAGRSTRVETEIDRSYCQAEEIPILRRCSGGAAIVGGPGCLMYSIVLSLQRQPELRRIDAAHRFVMSRVLAALNRQIPDAQLQGTCDLTWQNRKCSGNSLRITRGHLLYHGTMLYRFDLPVIARCLKLAPRQPEYRMGRDHESFVINVPIDRDRFREDLANVFEATGQTDAESLEARIRQLRRDRYDSSSWHFRH